MTDSGSGMNLEDEGPEDFPDAFLDGEYSVWDLGPLADQDPEVIARFDAIEEQLIAMSEQTALRRVDEMSLVLDDEEDRRQVSLAEMANHRQRVDRLKVVLYQMRTGVDF
jgi:hypothetical protein